MPEFTLDEADHCPHCGAVLREPPKCCQTARDEFDAAYKRWEDSQQPDCDPGARPQ